MLEIAVDFWSAIAIPVDAFFAEGVVFFMHREDVWNAVFVQVIACGLPRGFCPGHMRALAGAVEAQAQKQRECKRSVFHFAHGQFVSYSMGLWRAKK